MSVSEGRAPRSPANFCAQAADLVRVRSLSCTRNARSRHFRQKNTYVLAQFPSDPLPGLLWPRCLPDASQMSPRCLPDASQMPLRCLSDASQMPPDASQMPPDASPKKLFGVSRWGNFLAYFLMPRLANSCLNCLRSHAGACHVGDQPSNLMDGAHR